MSIIDAEAWRLTAKKLEAILEAKTVELARLTAEGKELREQLCDCRWAPYGPCARCQACDQKTKDLAEARRRLGLAVKWLRLSDHRAADGELGLMDQITRARDEFRASLPAKPSGGEP